MFLPMSQERKQRSVEIEEVKSKSYGSLASKPQLSARAPMSVTGQPP